MTEWPGRVLLEFSHAATPHQPKQHSIQKQLLTTSVQKRFLHARHPVKARDEAAVPRSAVMTSRSSSLVSFPCAQPWASVVGSRAPACAPAHLHLYGVRHGVPGDVHCFLAAVLETCGNLENLVTHLGAPTDHCTERLIASAWAACAHTVMKA